MQNREDIQAAIDALNDAAEKVGPLLSSVPALRVRADNALRTLIGGLGHTIQGSSLPAQQPGVSKPLTHIFGTRVARDNKPLPPATVQVPDADVEELRQRARDAYVTFRERDNKALMESLTDMELRAVAKLAGLPVTATEPKKMTLEFIKKIKAAITQKEEEEAAAAEAEETTAAAEQQAATGEPK